MKFTPQILLLVIALLIPTLSPALAAQPEKQPMNQSLRPGDLAPDFTYVDPETSETVSLSSLQGQSVLLVFYPKAFSRGCVRQLGEYKKEIALFKESNTKIIAVSNDKQEDSDRFREKFEFPFVLIGDSELEIIEKYDIPLRKWVGKKYAQRSIFLIDEKGVIQFINLDYEVKSSKQEIYDQIRKRIYQPLDPRLN